MFDSTCVETKVQSSDKPISLSSLSQKEEMARANGVPEWRLQYNKDFESVVRGHHIYKTVWKPETTEKRLHFMMKM